MNNTKLADQMQEAFARCTAREKERQDGGALRSEPRTATLYIEDACQQPGATLKVFFEQVYPMMINGPLKGCHRIGVSADTLRIIRLNLGEGPYYWNGVRTAVFYGNMHHAGEGYPSDDEDEEEA